MVLSHWLQLFQRRLWLSRIHGSPRSEARKRRRKAEYTDVPAFFESMEERVMLTDFVSLAVIDANASELSGDTGTFRVSRSGSVGGLTVAYTVAGASTATAGSDYTALSGSVSFANGETWKDIIVSPVNDAVAESSETVTITLSPAVEEEYNLGSPTTGTVRIADDDSGSGLIQFSVTGGGSVTEDATDGDGNTVPYTIGYSGTLTGNQTASVDVSHVLNQTSTADYATNVVSAITAAVASTPGTSFNGTTLTFGPVPASTTSTSRYAGTAVDGAGGSGAWSNVTTAAGSNTADYASTQIDWKDYSNQLRLTNFGFNIPTNATINGITVTLDTTGSDTNRDGPGVFLTKSGSTSVGTAPASSSNWGNGSVVVGNAYNLWATTWTPAEINASTFGTIVRVRSDDDGYQYRVHTAQILVSYTTPGSAAPTSLNFTAQIADDSTGEVSEGFSVALSNATTTSTPGATISTPSASATIVDNDGPVVPAVSITAQTPTVLESESNAANYGRFRVSRSDASTPLTVQYAVDGASTAAAAADYTSLTGSVTFAVGEFFQDILVTPVNDAVYETSETLKVNLLAATAGEYVLSTQPSENTATVTITDDDMVVWVSGTQSGVEGSQDGTLTFTRSSDAVALTVAYQVLTSSLAQSGSDYIAPSGTVSFAIGQLTSTVTIGVIDDTVIEPSETVNIQILPDTATGTYLVGSPAMGTVTIVDNDIATVSISATDPNAGETGPDTGLFTITRNGSTTGALTVNFTLTGTATNGTDYAQILVSESTGWGSVTIPAGQTSTTLTLTPMADNSVESAETVIVSLLAPAGYTVESTMGAATVTIADGPPIGDPIEFSITGGQSVTEDTTDGDNNQVTYTIGYTGDLSSGESASIDVAHVLDQTVAADYSTSVAAAINAAVAETPGTSFNGTTLTFGAPSTATASMYAGTAVAAAGTGDSAWNSVAAATGSNAATYAFAEIDNHDYSDHLRLTNYGFNIPSNATITGISVVVNTTGSSSNRSNPGVYLSKNGTASVGTPPASSSNWNSGTVTVGTGSQLWGSTWTPAEINSSSFGTILNVESSQSGGEFRVASAQILVSYTVPVASAPTSLTFTIEIADDTLVETSEQYSVTLSNPSTDHLTGATIDIGTVTTTITDNDIPVIPVVTVTALDSVASEAVNNTGTFRFSRSDAGAPLTVTYSVDAASTATSGADYATLSGTVSFAAGELWKDVIVTPVNDQLMEPDETVIVTLQSAANGEYTLGTNVTATVTIADDDIGVWVSAVQNGTEGGSNGSITLQRNSTLGSLTVNVQIDAGATAQNGTDFPWIPGTVVFPNGALTVVIPVNVIDDSIVETTEQFTLRVYWDEEESGNYVVGTPATGTVTITDNDVAPIPVVTIVSQDPLIMENAATPGKFRVQRTVTTDPLTVNYQVETTSTATAGSDYVALSGTVTFAAGEAWRDIDIQPIDDTESEDGETIIVTLLAATAGQYTLGQQTSATTTISDDDIQVHVASVQNATEGGTNGSITLQRSSSVGTFSVVMTIEAATAVNGIDFAWLPVYAEFPDGALTVVVPIDVTDDLDVESDEYLTIRIADNVLDGGYSVGSPATGTVQIFDNDVAAVIPVSTVTIEAIDATVAEGNLDSGTYRITRSSSQGPLTVRYEVSQASTAISGRDFLDLGSFITFDDGEEFVDITLIAVDDFIVEYSETAVLSLLPALPSDMAYTLGTTTEATVTIEDNDGSVVPIVSLVAVKSQAFESGLEDGLFRVSRSNGLGELTVGLTIVAGSTAVSGDDYTPIPLSVTFADGEMYRDIPITAIDDLTVESPETLTVQIEASDRRGR